MFEAVVPYLSPEKREIFDSFSGIWQMMEMMKEMDFGDPANMADMMNGFQAARDMPDMMSGFQGSQDMPDMMNRFQTERMDENERMDGASGSCESGSAETGADPDSGDESRWQERESAGTGDDVADHRRE